jgi:hypothetical protein
MIFEKEERLKGNKLKYIYEKALLIDDGYSDFD